MKIDRKDIEMNLLRKGFDRSDDGDHIFFHHAHNGKKTSAYTKISHTKKMRDISGGLLTAIRKQLKLDSNREVVDLVTCPMDGDRYNSILIQKGIFRP